MVTLVADAMRAVDPGSYAGGVLDGFPRTAAQAKALEAALTGYAPDATECICPAGTFDALVADGSPFIAKLSTAFDADAQPEVLSQLHLFTLWRTERLARRGGDDAAVGAALPPSLAEACRAAFHRHQTSPSALQAQVKATLEDLLQLPLEEEVLTEEGYSLDLAATIGSTKVAFEVDGPIHFLGARQGGAGRRPLPSRTTRS